MVAAILIIALPKTSKKKNRTKGVWYLWEIRYVCVSVCVCVCFIFRQRDAMCVCVCLKEKKTGQRGMVPWEIR